MRFSIIRWLLIGLAVAVLPSVALADWGAVNMTKGVTEISREVHDLHMTIFYICCLIGIAVFAVMFYSIFKHRKSQGSQAADFHESTTVEIVWTVVPLVILIAMAIPAARVLIKMEDFTDSEMSIKVTGYQWRWQYEYLEEGISFYSQLDPEHNAARQKDSGVDLTQFDNYLREVDKPLVVPVGKKIRFLHTSADVIHSWWVPAFSIKKDANPGFINENWALIEEPGVYRGKCTELCGRDHGFMPVVVHAVPQEEYDQWVIDQQELMAVNASQADRQWSKEELVAQGEKVYGASCLGCHQAEGQGIPGMFPAIAGSDIATGDIETHIQTVLMGIPDTPMDGYGSKLDDTDLAAVVTYQRNAFGNNLNDTVQPYQIKSLRQGLQQSSAALDQFDITQGVN